MRLSIDRRQERPKVAEKEEGQKNEWRRRENEINICHPWDVAVVAESAFGSSRRYHRWLLKAVPENAVVPVDLVRTQPVHSVVL